MDQYLNHNDPVIVTDELTGEPLAGTFIRFDTKTGRAIVRLSDTGKVIPVGTSSVSKPTPPTSTQ